MDPLLLLLLLFPAVTSWRHKTTPTAATTLAYCAGLTRILLPLGRGVVRTYLHVSKRGNNAHVGWGFLGEASGQMSAPELRPCAANLLV